MVLVVGRRERGDLQRLQVLEVRADGVLGRQAFRVQVLEALLDQHVPVRRDLVEGRDPCAGVGGGVLVLGDDVLVVDRGRVGQGASVCGRARKMVGADARGVRLEAEIGIADVGVGAGEGRRHIVDIAAAALVIDNRADGQLVLDDRDVEGRVGQRVRRAAGGAAVAGLRIGLVLGEVGLVGDVAHRAGFRPAAEQGALRALEHFDAVHIDHVDVHVARRELERLVVQIHRDVGEVPDGGAGLVAGETGAQAADEDVALSWPVVAIGYVWRVFQQIVERGDVQLRQSLAREGLDGHRDLFDRLAPPLGGHDNLVNGGRRCAGGGCCGRVDAGERSARRDHGGRAHAYRR